MLNTATPQSVIAFALAYASNLSKCSLSMLSIHGCLAKQNPVHGSYCNDPAGSTQEQSVFILALNMLLLCLIVH